MILLQLSFEFEISAMNDISSSDIDDIIKALTINTSILRVDFGELIFFFFFKDQPSFDKLF